MHSVKRNLAIWLWLAALVMPGCVNYQWARLAPPGILKYEDVASEKPVNPAIAAEIAQLEEQPGARFPVLSQTPAAKARLTPPPRGDIDESAAELFEARSVLDEALADHGDLTAAAREELDALNRTRDRLQEEIERDRRMAAGERAVPLAAPSDAPGLEH